MTPLSSVSPTTRNSQWHFRTLGIQEFESLINLMPQAACLVDSQRGIILFGNKALYRLTAFSQQDLSGAPITNLIEQISLDDCQSEQNIQVMITRRNRPPLPIVVQIHILDSTRKILLLQIEPSHNPDQISFSLGLRDIFQLVNELNTVIDCSDEPRLMNNIVETVRKVTSASSICIYRADHQFPKLSRIAFWPDPNIFPEEIFSTDLVRLSNPFVWIPGKRVQTEIHRAGRVANLAYVASTPLGQESALAGLLIIGGVDPLPGQNPIEFLKFLGQQIHFSIQQSLLVNNLQSENNRIEGKIVVQKGVVDNIHEGALILQPDFQILEINPAAELMLGYADKEVKGQQVENILIGPEGLLPALDNARQGIPTLEMGVVSLHRRNGQSFPAQIQIVPILKENTVLAINILVTDVTADEQIRVRTQQLEQRAILGDFTAVFAHEVRNPINNISMGAQLLGSRMNPGDPNFDVIQRMLGDCTRLNHLMESVLSFSRPMESTFIRLDISQLLQRIIDRWQPRLSRVNIHPFFQSSPNLPMVMGDMRSLEQVFTNLITNAVEAMSKSGGILAVHVLVSSGIPNRPHVEVSISDNGPGIPDEIRERIFEPFVTTNARGTGLGLAISKRIVTAHQGSISVNSFPGGTVFRVFLPAVEIATVDGEDK